MSTDAIIENVLDQQTFMSQRLQGLQSELFCSHVSRDEMGLCAHSSVQDINTPYMPNDTTYERIDHPILEFLSMLNKKQREHVMYNLSEIESYMTSWDVCLSLHNSQTLCDLEREYKYIIDAFRIVCPKIIMYIDIDVEMNAGVPQLYDFEYNHESNYLREMKKINANNEYIWYLLRLNWDKGDMDPIVYNKNIFPEIMLGQLRL